MFCCAGLASICRSPCFRVRGLRRELREGQLAAALFLSAPTIRPCLALFNFPPNNILRSRPHLARPTAHSPPPQLRPPQNTTGFISLASHLQSSLPEQIVRIGALPLLDR